MGSFFFISYCKLDETERKEIKANFFLLIILLGVINSVCVIIFSVIKYRDFAWFESAYIKFPNRFEWAPSSASRTIRSPGLLLDTHASGLLNSLACLFSLYYKPVEKRSFLKHTLFVFLLIGCTYRSAMIINLMIYVFIFVQSHKKSFFSFIRASYLVLAFSWVAYKIIRFHNLLIFQSYENFNDSLKKFGWFYSVAIEPLLDYIVRYYVSLTNIQSYYNFVDYAILNGVRIIEKAIPGEFLYTVFGFGFNKKYNFMSNDSAWAMYLLLFGFLPCLIISKFLLAEGWKYIVYNRLSGDGVVFIWALFLFITSIIHSDLIRTNGLFLIFILSFCFLRLENLRLNKT